MTSEEFNRLVSNCQPHPVANSEWQVFFPNDFGETLLPNVQIYIATSLRLYDGAELFKGIEKAEGKVLQLTSDKELFSLISYTYPKGVEAERKRNRVQVGDYQICTFIEVAQDDSAEVFFNLGSKFRQFLAAYFKSNKLPDITNAVENKAFKTDISSLKKHFNKTLVHYNMMDFIGNTIGINLTEVNDELVLKVKLIGIKAKTSEPSDNKNKKVKDKKQKFIIVDFEILNQPAINYSVHIYRGNAKIYEQICLPEIVAVANKNSKGIQKNKNDADKPNLHQPDKYQIIWDCTDNNVFDVKDDKEKLTIRIQAVGTEKQIAIAQKEILLKETIDQAEVDNFIILLDKENNKTKIFGSEILKRQKKIKDAIPIAEFAKLSIKEQLIIDLSIILVKLGWLYGAFCQINWLECNGADVIFPYEFIMNYPRAQAPIKLLQEDLKLIEYAALLDWTNKNGNTAPPPPSLFMYHENLDSFPENYNKALDVLRKVENNEPQIFGNFDFTEEAPKMNFVRSYSIGSEVAGFATGDKDDLGAALGLFGLRVYVRGAVTENVSNVENYREFKLTLVEIGFRFADDFSFNGFQPLGAWKYDLVNVKEPEIASTKENWYNLFNETYRDLRKKLPQLGGDFQIYTQPLFFSPESTNEITFFINS